MIFDIKAHADISLSCSLTPAMVNVLDATSKTLLFETLRLMQHATILSSYNSMYGKASAVIMLHKNFFATALVLCFVTNMTVTILTIIKTVATTMKNHGEQALAKLHLKHNG